MKQLTNDQISLIADALNYHICEYHTALKLTDFNQIAIREYYQDMLRRYDECKEIVLSMSESRLEELNHMELQKLSGEIIRKEHEDEQNSKS